MAGERVVVVRRPLDGPEQARLSRLLRAGRVVTCDVAALTEPDLATVDALARLQLAAGRTGARLRLRAVPAALRELLELAGLAGLLPG